MPLATDFRPNAALRSIDAHTGDAVGDGFTADGPDDPAAACVTADRAVEAYRAAGRLARAGFLEATGAEILATGDDLIATAMRESGLPRARLEGERGRTIGQLRLFADVVRRRADLGLRVDFALPDRARHRRRRVGRFIEAARRAPGDSAAAPMLRARPPSGACDRAVRAAGIVPGSGARAVPPELRDEAMGAAPCLVDGKSA